MREITVQKWVKTRSGHIWRSVVYDMDAGPDLARMIARDKFAWPGGYEMAAVTDDGGLLCHDCCRREYYMIRTASSGDGWNVSGLWVEDGDSEAYCDHCGRVISEGGAG